MSTEAIKKMLTVQEDKVPIIVLTKLSPDYIEAWKAPKKLRATVLNQYMRCVKFYVETTINNVSPLMKNTEHYEPKIPTIKPKHISKITLDEAREFIGNVELTKRTRNQQKEIHSVSQPDENEKICILSETEVKGLKRTRSASLYSPNCVEIEVTKCIASTNNLKDNATKSVKAQQISRDNYNFAEDLHSVFKKCKLSAKTKQSQSRTSSSNNKLHQNGLDMPELIDSDKCQHTDVMESTVRPKIVLKIKKYTPKSYESYSDDYDKKEGSKKLELPKIVPKNSVAEKLKPNNITSTFTNEHGHGEGIGHKDIKTMKPCRKKVSLKTVKPLIKHESIIKKVIKPHHRSAARESLFTCSETSDSDDIPPKTKKINTNGQITKPLRHSSAADKSKVVFKKLRCKSLYEHLFGNDIDDIVTSSNNEECQNVHDEFKNMMNGKITSKIIHTDDVNINLVNKDGNNGRSSINDSNNNTVTEESNNNGSSNVDDDDSDVISLCADEDFVDEITIDDTNTPTITPKNVNSAMKSTPACWTSAVLEDCRMTLRKDTECDTPQQVLNANNATRNFNINTKTIVMNMPIIPNKQVISMLKQVFNRLCVEFVRDNCKNNCKQLHEFPSADVVRQNMTNVNLTIIENAYEFMKNYPKMFLMYFPVFCDVFSFFKLPNRLKAMFLDCERQTRTIDYYRHVVAGLTKTGMLKYKSIWMCIQNTTDSPYARETITNMIAETGPDVVRFVDYLKHCGTLPMPMFNKILEQCVTYQNPDLQYYLFSSFQQSLQHQTVVSQVNQSNMIKFIQLIKRSQQFNTEKMEENLVHVLEKVCCI